LESSNNTYAQFLAASSIKNLFNEHWIKIPVEEKIAIKDYLLNYLATKALQSDK